MISFFEYFEHRIDEAVVRRNPVFIDEADIKYLKQFPHRNWGQALGYRYNDLLFKAIGSDGYLKSDWSDLQSMTMKLSKGGSKSFKINTGITKLFKKLQVSGIDFRGMNDQTKTALYFKPINAHQANNILSKLKRSASNYEPAGSGKTVEWEPVPNVVKISLTHLMKTRDDAEPVGGDGLGKREDYEKHKDEIGQEIQNAITNLQKAAKQGHASPNIHWWAQPSNSKKLWTEIAEAIWLNWNNEKLKDKKFRRGWITQYIRGRMQKGMVSRRIHDKLKTKHNFNITDMLNQVNPQTGLQWTPIELKRVVDLHGRDHEGLVSYFQNPPQKKWSGPSIFGGLGPVPKAG